jgi:hypothetical protein
MVGGHKEIFVKAPKASPTDALVDRLNRELEEVVAWEDLRSSEALAFAIWKKEIVASAKVQGDDWDLAIYLRGLAEVSRRHPDLVFVVEFAPDGGRTQLANGDFGKRSAEILAFLKSMDVPRPELEQLRAAQDHPEPQAPDEPTPRSAPRVLARHPRAAPALSGLELVWLDWEDETVRLQADGTLRSVEPEPRFLGRDGTHAYFQDDTVATIVDLATGRVARHSVPPLPTLRKPYGFVGTSVLAADLRFEALGRMKEQLMLLDPDGTTRSGDSFVNVADLRILADEQRALLIAEIDGQERLITLELPTLAWSARTLWKSPLEGKAILARPDGAVLLLDRKSSRGPRRLELLLAGSDEGEARLISTIPIGFESVADFEGDSAWLVCFREEKDRIVRDLVHVDLDRGNFDIMTKDISHQGEGRLEQAIRTGGAWAIYYRWEGVFVLENGKLDKVYSSNEGEELSIALSPAGMLAVLASEDSKAVLHLLRGGAKVISIPLERGGRGLRWVGAG